MDKLKSIIGGFARVVYTKQLGKVRDTRDGKRVLGLEVVLGSVDEMKTVMGMWWEMEQQLEGHVVPNLSYEERVVRKRRVEIMMRLRDVGMSARIEGTQLMMWMRGSRKGDAYWAEVGESEALGYLSG